jgi:hypothetical protein
MFVQHPSEEPETTVDGYDMQFGTNVMGKIPYYMLQPSN